MVDIVLNSSSVTPGNPATPPSGWQLTAGSSGGVAVDGATGSFFDTNFAYSGWNCTDTPSRTGNLIKSRIVMGASSNFDSYFAAVTLVDSAGAGYLFEIQPYNYKIYKFAAGQIAGALTQIGSSSSGAAPSLTDYFELQLNVSTGALIGSKNGSSVVTATDTDYVSNTLKSGFALAGYVGTSGISQVTAYDVSSHSITSINDGDPIEPGQTFAVEADFSGKPTAVTATYGAQALGATIGAGTGASFSVTLQDRVDGEDWPIDGGAVTFAFTYASEFASADATVRFIKSDELLQTFVDAVTDDLSYVTGGMTALGYVVEGAQWGSPAVAGAFDPDGDNHTPPPLDTYDCWLRPIEDGSNGSLAGRIYKIVVPITLAAEIPIIQCHVGRHHEGEVGSEVGFRFPDGKLQTKAAHFSEVAKIVLGSNLTTAAATYTKLALDTQRFDTGGFWRATTGRIIPREPGYYQVSARLQMSADVSMHLALAKNGTRYSKLGDQGSRRAVAGGCLVYCNGTTDYLELQYYTVDAVATDIGADDCYLEIAGPL